MGNGLETPPVAVREFVVADPLGPSVETTATVGDIPPDVEPYENGHSEIYPIPITPELSTNSHNEPNKQVNISIYPTTSPDHPERDWTPGQIEACIGAAEENDIPVRFSAFDPHTGEEVNDSLRTDTRPAVIIERHTGANMINFFRAWSERIPSEPRQVFPQPVAAAPDTAPTVEIRPTIPVTPKPSTNGHNGHNQEPDISIYPAQRRTVDQIRALLRASEVKGTLVAVAPDTAPKTVSSKETKPSWGELIRNIRRGIQKRIEAVRVAYPEKIHDYRRPRRM